MRNTVRRKVSNLMNFIAKISAPKRYYLEEILMNKIVLFLRDFLLLRIFLECENRKILLYTKMYTDIDYIYTRGSTSYL